jgi:hypothetical protein
VVFVPDDERLITDEAVLWKNANEEFGYSYGFTETEVGAGEKIFCLIPDFS